MIYPISQLASSSKERTSVKSQNLQYSAYKNRSTMKRMKETHEQIEFEQKVAKNAKNIAKKE
jgi:hypothetical protein